MQTPRDLRVDQEGLQCNRVILCVLLSLLNSTPYEYNTRIIDVWFSCFGLSRLSRPFFHKCVQGGERAASTAVSACLTLLVRLEEEGSSYVVDNSPCLPHAARSIGGSASTAPNNRSGSSTSGVDSRVGQGGSWCVSPEVKLYHLANACLYGATVLSEKGADKNFEWLLRR